jgi:hypothetical protein
MPSLSRRTLYQINQRPRGKQSKNNAMYQSPDKIFYLPVYARNQTSCSRDEGRNLQLGSLTTKCRLDYVSTRMAGISVPFFRFLHGNLDISYDFLILDLNCIFVYDINLRSSVKYLRISGRFHPFIGHEGPYGQKRYSFTLFLTSVLEGGEGSASRPDRILPPGKNRYPLCRRLGGPQGRSAQVGKISPTPGFDPRTVHPVGSRYTDYATRPPTQNISCVAYKPIIEVLDVKK